MSDQEAAEITRMVIRAVLKGRNILVAVVAILGTIGTSVFAAGKYFQGSTDHETGQDSDIKELKIGQKELSEKFDESQKTAQAYQRELLTAIHELKK